MNGACNNNFFGPAFWGPWEGSTGQISFNFKNKLNFKVFFLQMKNTKHIRRDVNSVAWVMPQGLDFWALGVPRGAIFFSNMVMWNIKLTLMKCKTECK